MAASSNIKILSLPVQYVHVIEYPKASTEVIAQGDLLEENGSGAEVVDGAANDVFIGVAMTGCVSASVAPIAVMIKGVIFVTMGAGESATFGQALKYNAGANGTDWDFATATAEGIVWALETISTAGTGKALVDVLALETGIFEAVTGTSTSTSTSSSTSTSTTTTTA